MSDTLKDIAAAVRSAAPAGMPMPDPPPAIAPGTPACKNCGHMRDKGSKFICGLKGGPLYLETVALAHHCDDFLDAYQVKAGKQRRAAAPKAAAAGGGGELAPVRKGLPGDCPVRPLGQTGTVYHYLDGLRQIISLQAKEHARLHLAGLFGGNNDYLVANWPRLNSDGQVTGAHFDQIAYDLMEACRRKGIWSVDQKLRGRGLWWDDEEDMLVVHLGDQVLTQERSGHRRAQEPDEIGAYVYPAGEPLWRPDFGALRDEDENGTTAGGQLLQLFRTWQWARPEVDPVLLVGWIAAALIGGASPWRPMGFLIGDAGCGKSTLMKILKHALGPWLLDTTDTTPAGVRQALGSDCRPVAIDEAEGSADGRNDGLIELARLAASGGKTNRGSADHKAVQFQTRSAMLFGAIQPPAMGDADLSRFAMMQLRPLSAHAKRPAIDALELGKMGRRMLARIVRDHGRLEQRFDEIEAVIREAGHGARGADTFGRLLACAELVIGPMAEALRVPLNEHIGEWSRMLAASAMVETADRLPNWRQCLMHLLTVPVEAWRAGARPTIGTMLEAYRLYQEDPAHPGAVQLDDINLSLRHAGVRIIAADRDGPDRLFIPTRSAQVQRLYWQTRWYGQLGNGGWTIALQQAPDGIWRAEQRRIFGQALRGTSVRLDACTETDPAPQSLLTGAGGSDDPIPW